MANEKNNQEPLIISQLVTLESLVSLLIEKNIITEEELIKRINDVKKKISAKPRRFNIDKN